jgi:hypothetical protein
MKELYVPLLRARHGEFVALSHLSKRASRHILPLLDLPKIKTPAKDKIAKSIEEHLQAVALKISKAWPKEVVSQI